RNNLPHSRFAGCHPYAGRLPPHCTRSGVRLVRVIQGGSRSVSRLEKGAEKAGMAQSYRVLVIDDDPGLRDYLEALASTRGYRVTTAATGEEALRKLDDTQPDLVTLDLVLPGMDGLETLTRIKERLPDVPVVMLSGHGQARNIVEAMKLGASDFLRKPFEVEELEVAFQKALEKRALRKEVEELRGRVRSETELLMLCGDDPK